MIARLAALLCLLALAAPGPALAQGPFQPLPPAPPPQPTTVVEPDPSDDGDDGLSSTQQLLIGLSGIILLGGIAWAILRDARSAAPVLRRKGSGADEDVHRPKGSQKPAGVRHRQSRAKAKAARQARKRARKR